MQTTLDKWLASQQKQCENCKDLYEILGDHYNHIAKLLLNVESLQRALLIVTDVVVGLSRPREITTAVEQARIVEVKKKDESEVNVNAREGKEETQSEKAQERGQSSMD